MSNMNRMNATITVETAAVVVDHVVEAVAAAAVEAPVEARVNHKYNESCVQTNFRS
jgi:hypothetical protein